MPRVLLLMTTQSYRASAFMGAAARIGAEVTVGSERPQALAAANPAGHLTLDFRSPEAAGRAVVEFAARFPIAAVLAADDDGAILAAAAAAALGLRRNPGAAVEAARDKHRMREILAAAGLPSPRFRLFSSDDDPAAVAGRVEFPCVVKPLSLAASRGVIRADDAAQFAVAFRRVAALVCRPDAAPSGAAPAPRLLAESYIPGVEVALEGILTRGRLRVLALFDKPDPLEGPFFEETIYVTPSRHPPAVQAALTARAAEVAEALGLVEGPVHAELRVNEAGVWPLEIAPRSIGGLCSRALRFGQGASLEELILRHALGQDVSALEREHRAAGVMMIPIPRAGVLRGVAGQDEACRVAGIEDIRVTIPTGAEVVPWPEGSRYLGFIFARAGMPEEVEAALREAHRRLRFDIAPAGSPAPAS